MAERALTRRSLALAGAAALGSAVTPIAATAVPRPAVDLDADLYALLDRFDAARAAWDATEAPLEAAWDRLAAALPPRPDALRHHFRDYGHDLGGTRGREMGADGRWVAFYADEDVKRLRNAPPILQAATVGDDVDPVPMEPDPNGEARRHEIVAAHDAWGVACRRAEDEAGFTAASAAETAAAAAWNAADEAVKLCRPRTLAGLARKAAWVAGRLRQGCDDDLGEVFALQVAAFGEVAP